MAAITKEQIKRVYSLGAGADILDRGNKEDDLHALVYNHTGKISVRELTSEEFQIVERELLRLMRMGNRRVPLKRDRVPHREKASEASAGMMTEKQKAYAWRLIYRLCELDDRAGTPPGERMCGAIRRILEIDVGTKDPMKWITFEAGGKLIEQLKRYVRSAESRAKAKEGGY